MRSSVRRPFPAKRTARIPGKKRRRTPGHRNFHLPPVHRLFARLNTKLDNIISRIESGIDLHLFFETGEILPPLNGWAVAPDFAMLLVRLLQAKAYDCILEFGSGSSTAVLAKALQILNRVQTIHEVFEHDRFYLEKTRQLLLAVHHASPTIHHVPLHEWLEGKQKYLWYDCGPILSACAERLANRPKLSMLAVVDGPPGYLCKNSRYPVIPHILDAFPDLAGLDIVLDDAIRVDERNVGYAWHTLLEDRGWKVSVEKLPLEKGALVLRAQKGGEA